MLFLLFSARFSQAARLLMKKILANKIRCIVIVSSILHVHDTRLIFKINARLSTLNLEVLHLVKQILVLSILYCTAVVLMY